MQRPPIFTCILCKQEKHRGNEMTCCSGADCNSRDCVCKYCDPNRTVKFYCSEQCKPTVVAAAPRPTKSQKRARAASDAAHHVELVQKATRWDEAKKLHDEMERLQEELKTKHNAAIELEASIKKLVKDLDDMEAEIEKEKAVLVQATLDKHRHDLQSMLRAALASVDKTESAVFCKMHAMKVQYDALCAVHADQVQKSLDNAVALDQKRNFTQTQKDALEAARHETMSIRRRWMQIGKEFKECFETQN